MLHFISTFQFTTPIHMSLFLIFIPMFSDDKPSKESIERKPDFRNSPKTHLPSSSTYGPHSGLPSHPTNSQSPQLQQLQQVSTLSPHQQHQLHQLHHQQTGGLVPLQSPVGHGSLSNLSGSSSSDSNSSPSLSGAPDLQGVSSSSGCPSIQEEIKVKQESPAGGAGSSVGHNAGGHVGFASVCSPSPALMTPPMTPGLSAGLNCLNLPGTHPMLGSYQAPSGLCSYSKHLSS